MIDFLAWIHAGAGLSFQTQVWIKTIPLLALLCVLFFVPDSDLTRNKSAWPVRISRTWLAIATALILVDYYDDGYAKHLLLANFYSATLSVIVANRWAARHLSRFVPAANPYEAP